MMGEREPLLEVRHLKKYFGAGGKKELKAVDDVSFTIYKGETFGIVGESGCGKTTCGRTCIGVYDATEGEVFYRGKDIRKQNKKERKEFTRKVQMIFQDPFSSINPRMSVSEIIGEPLKIYKAYDSEKEYRERVSEIMETVGLAERLANAYPHELDGGRRQRIGIGRALALNPKFIVCDEPVSALDVSIQAQILNLIKKLQKERKITYIFITHDLSVVKHISDDIAVMYLGMLVEKSGAKELFKYNLHPYTKALLAAIPRPKIGANKNRILLKGEITSPINPGKMCRFASRCQYATEKCYQEVPELEEVLPQHFVACHHVKKKLMAYKTSL